MNTNQGFGLLLAQLGYHGLLRDGKCKNCIVKWTLNPAKSPEVSASPRIVVTMPAYNAAKTLLQTFNDIPKELVSEIIMVDDCSHDETVSIGGTLPIRVIRHPSRTGYGGNQKTCYAEALNSGADIVVMLHPDYQYDPHKIPQIWWRRFYLEKQTSCLARAF